MSPTWVWFSHVLECLFIFVFTFPLLVVPFRYPPEPLWTPRSAVFFRKSWQTASSWLFQAEPWHRRDISLVFGNESSYMPKVVRKKNQVAWKQCRFCSSTTSSPKTASWNPRVLNFAVQLRQFRSQSATLLVDFNQALLLLTLVP